MQKFEWISPSKIIFGSSPRGEGPKPEVITDFQEVNERIRKKPNPTLTSYNIDILDSTQVFVELGLKSLAQQLPLHSDSQKYFEINSPLGILRFLQILAGVQVPTGVLSEIIGIIFHAGRWYRTQVPSKWPCDDNCGWMGQGS